MENIKVLSGASNDERKVRKSFYELYLESPIDKNEHLQNLGMFINRMNLSRLLFMNESYQKIIGFDTFNGFPEVDDKDGGKITKGDYGVSENYENYLTKILQYHEAECPIAHKKKFELIKGDATKTFKEYLNKNTETIVAFAYFDFDIYMPTKICLELLLERVTKGSVIVFDELNCPEFPGETLALIEILGLKKYAIKRSPLNIP